MVDENVESSAEQSAGDAGSVAPRTLPAARVVIERLFEEHGDVLWRFAMARTRSREVAEEVVQETLVAAIRAHGQFSGLSSARTWLLGIAAHKISDHFRATRREARFSGAPQADGEESGVERGMFDEAGMWARIPGDWGLGGEESAERAEVLGALRACIEELPPSMSEVIWLRELQGMPAEEVCKALGLTATNLWTRMHRARNALRACVEKSLRGGKDSA